MSRQLSCRDMCKIVTWSGHCCSSKSNMNFVRFEVGGAPGPFVTWVLAIPCGSSCNCWWWTSTACMCHVVTKAWIIIVYLLHIQQFLHIDSMNPSDALCVSGLGHHWFRLWFFFTCTASSHHLQQSLLNTLRPRQNGRHFPDDIFKWIFLNENASILIKISPMFVPKALSINIPALVQIIAWRWPDDRPLSEPMIVN